MTASADPGTVEPLPRPSLREDRALAQELATRLPEGPWLRAVTVTDLLDPRRAFWRQLRGPAPITPERRARMDAGREFHRFIGRRLPGEGAFEVRVRRDGVAARIDLLADVPVEIKSSDEALPDDVVADRPEYVEQMALYCALLGRPSARLVHLRHGAEPVVDVRALDIAFGDPSTLRAELSARSGQLREAIDRKSPDRLPRCRWFRAGCEFRAAGICTCTGGEPPTTAAIAEQVVGVVARGDVEGRWQSALAEPAPSAPVPVARRYRDLVYPRRAFFEITDPGWPREPARVRPADHPPSGVYDGAVGAVEGGPVGEVCRMFERRRSPEEELAGWKGEPFLLRTSRAWSRVPVEQLFERFPQYAVELGFRCAVAGTERGRLVLAYERAATPADRLQVVEYSFGPGLGPYARLYEARTELLAQAVVERSPAGLAACPGWMTTDCPYRDRCGCPAESGLSQR